MFELMKAKNILKNKIKLAKREKWKELANDITSSIVLRDVWRQINVLNEKRAKIKRSIIVNEQNSIEFLYYNFGESKITTK